MLMKIKKDYQSILIFDIKSKDDIPEKVKKIFDDSYKFLEDFVCKENIVYASVHLDKDTPHLQFYFFLLLIKLENLQKQVYILEKDYVINHLSNGIEKLKNETSIKERDKLIEKQKSTINNQNNLIKEKIVLFLI